MGAGGPRIYTGLLDRIPDNIRWARDLPDSSSSSICVGSITVLSENRPLVEQGNVVQQSDHHGYLGIRGGFCILSILYWTEGEQDQWAQESAYHEADELVIHEYSPDRDLGAMPPEGAVFGLPSYLSTDSNVFSTGFERVRAKDALRSGHVVTASRSVPGGTQIGTDFLETVNPHDTTAPGYASFQTPGHVAGLSAPLDAPL
ncbi:hypothetical protein B0H14DRAFT_2645077 [Mycena olivaceomarginata]|nr:hypothetical protein B0H14DRAFT_2645077 [Mycena olivaceomarginata]